MVPKIIHHLAPANKKNWHPLWYICYESWKKQFDGFQFEMWDEERCNNFVLEKYPHQYSTFIEQTHIIRIDIVRYMIMYHYGGIIVDMDVFCYENFYDGIQTPLNLLESMGEDELVTNCLMLSIPYHELFKSCVEISFKRIKEFGEFDLKSNSNYVVKYIGGPFLLSDVYRRMKDFYPIEKMPANLFHGDLTNLDQKLITRHFMTGFWGTEVINVIKSYKHEYGYSHLSDEEYYLIHYKNFRGVDSKKIIKNHTLL